MEDSSKEELEVSKEETSEVVQPTENEGKKKPGKFGKFLEKGGKFILWRDFILSFLFQIVGSFLFCSFTVWGIICGIVMMGQAFYFVPKEFVQLFPKYTMKKARIILYSIFVAIFVLALVIMLVGGAGASLEDSVKDIFDDYLTENDLDDDTKCLSIEFTEDYGDGTYDALAKIETKTDYGKIKWEYEFEVTYDEEEGMIYCDVDEADFLETFALDLEENYPEIWEEVLEEGLY